METLSGKVKKRKIPATETEIDRLRALPDSLVFQILDRLGFKEAVKTALLSKQWRYLWTNLPLAFRDESENLDEIGSFVAGVRSALAVRRGPALHSLLFAFLYHESFASDVDSWLDFAAKIEVRNLSLHLESDPRKSRYDLPQIIYSNRSLTELSLRTCNAPPPEAAVEWRRLRRLSMVYVRLTQRAIDGILSGCPALEALDLTGCFGFNRLEIGGRRFRLLNVSYCYLREISAAYMRDLEVVVYCGVIRRGEIRLQNAPYLERACVDFYTHLIDEKVMINAFNLLHDLRHVRSLELSPRFIEVVSMMATNGRKIPQLKVKDLQVYGVDDAHSLHGVVAMLESCPYIEKLVMFSTSSYWPKEEVDWGLIRRDDFNCDLMHLKLTSFGGFLGSSNSDEPAIRLLQILLSRAPSLEKVIYITRRSRVGCKPCNDVERTLTSLPRSSPHASFEIL